MWGVRIGLRAPVEITTLVPAPLMPTEALNGTPGYSCSDAALCFSRSVRGGHVRVRGRFLFPLCSAFLVVLTSFSAFQVRAQAPDAATLTPGNNLIIEGLPAVPLSLVEAASPYLDSRNATLLSWDPKRRQILVSTRFAQ